MLGQAGLVLGQGHARVGAAVVGAIWIGTLWVGIGRHARQTTEVRPERVPPGPGQESVWDYPRPPAVVPGTHHVTVHFADRLVADTRRPVRVLETSQAPAFYLPLADIDVELLVPAADTTWCEWKGRASYVDLVVGHHVSPSAGWTYAEPAPGFEAIAGHVAFYPQRVGRCTVDGEEVAANGGDFYGGWITSTVVGPFKGAAGTSGW